MAYAKDIYKDVEDVLENKKMIKFVRWYEEGANPKEWDKVKQHVNNVTMEFALDTYLNRVDVQRAIKMIIEYKKDFNLIRIYQEMVKKALDGDVNSANWVVKFSESSFFRSKKSEIDNILESLDLGEDE